MDTDNRQEAALDGLKQEDQETDHVHGGRQCDPWGDYSNRTENEQTFDQIKKEDEDSDHEQAFDKVEIDGTDSKETYLVYKEDQESDSDEEVLGRVILKKEYDESDIKPEKRVSDSEGAFDQVEGHLQGADFAFGHSEQRVKQEDDETHCERVFDAVKEEQSQEMSSIPEQNSDIEESGEKKLNAEVETGTACSASIRMPPKKSALTAAEKQYLYRARIQSDPAKAEAAREKERKRWHERRQQKKVKGIADMTTCEARKTRKNWRKAYRERKAAKELKVFFLRTQNVVSDSASPQPGSSILSHHRT